MSKKTPEERFMAKVRIREDDCWEWTAHRLPTGYGQFAPSGKPVSAHRWSYQHFVAPIAEGVEVDHVCHNRDRSCQGGPACPHRRCVNPNHLEAVSHKVNMERGLTGHVNNPMAKKTHCPQGHPYDNANTRIHHSERTGKTARICKACNRARCRQWREKRMATTTSQSP